MKILLFRTTFFLLILAGSGFAQKMIPVPSGPPPKAKADDRWILTKVEYFPKEKSTMQPGRRGGSARYIINFHTKISASNSQVRQKCVSRDGKTLLGDYQVDYSWKPLPKIIKAGDKIPVSAEGKMTVNKEYPAAMLRNVTFGIIARGGFGTFRQTDTHVMSISRKKKSAKISSQIIVPKNPPSEFKIMTGGSRAKIFWHYQRNGKITTASPTPPPAPPIATKLRVVSLQALDANPLFNGNVMPKNLKPSQLIRANQKRNGTCADGISQLIIRAEVSDARPVIFTLSKAGRGSLRPLLGGRTVTLGGKHFAFALYTPPARFGGGSLKKTPKTVMSPAALPKKRMQDILEYEDLTITATPYKITRGGKGQPVLAGATSLNSKLARPPVILVHGLFSNPIDCWVKTKDTGASFVVMLERLGFMPFLVNYQKSNGTEVLGDSWLSGDRKNARTSSFQANRSVVWNSPDPYTPVAELEWFANEKSIRTPLQTPRNLRIGGIKQALKHYRGSLGLAATQTDVIGHSMGGILARVWASPNYNAAYRRAENYNQGDIHRLITLNTPHYGSELTELKDAIEKARIRGEGWLAWSRRSLAKKPLWWFTEAQAIQNLRTGSKALKRIGPTTIPSYAVATWAEDSVLGGNQFDVHNMYLNLYSVAGIMFFHNRALLDDFIDSRFLRWKNTAAPFKKLTDHQGNPAHRFNNDSAQASYRRIFSANLDHNVYFWASRREQAYWNDVRETVRKTAVLQYGTLSSDMGQTDMDLISSLSKSALSRILIGGDATRIAALDKPQDAPKEFMAQLRALVFHNDHQNDGAVRVSSQQGGLDTNEVIQGVLHSFSPWDYRVQRRLLALLKWEDSKFSQSGFGDAGQLTNRYLPTARFKDDRVRGERAIKWSGYVPSHAREYGKVADQRHVVILARPVNHDSTQLIIDGAATKAMAVKGKSSNWGPQRGFIPVNQRFSKIWRINAGSPAIREKNIAKFSAVTAKMLNKKHPVHTTKYYAKPVPLVVKINGKKYDVHYHPDADVLDRKTDADNAIVLHSSGAFYDWRNDGGKKFSRHAHPKKLTPQPSAELATAYLKTPMMVLADGLSNKEPKPYLTADYDLLAIGYHRADGMHGPPPEVIKAEANLDPIYGAASPRQINLIKELNEAVRVGAKYDSGNVTHHGPENQFSLSEFIDYPILVFDPGTQKSGDQEIFIIRQGPVGFRDIHLKRYFSEKIRQGFNLWPNPNGIGWLWRKSSTFTTSRSYDPRDHERLDKYQAEAPEPSGAPKVKIGKPSVARVHPRTPLPKAPTPDTGKPKTKKYSTMPPAELAKLANEGDLSAMSTLGVRYGKGEGVSKDQVIAAKYFHTAAKKGHPIAQLNLARRCQTGKGVPKNLERAIYWYKKSAAQGTANAHVGLGYLHAHGHGVPKNYTIALEHYRQAAEKNNGYALNNLGSFYKNGYGVRKDLNRAHSYYLKAAKMKNSLAMRNLGKIYSNGTGVNKDYNAARKWFESAMRSGDDKAGNHLGILYEKGGHGLDKNMPKALESYFQSAMAGYSSAQRNLAICHMFGKATPKNLTEAYAWLTVAADGGDKQADRERATTGRGLNNQQLITAQKRAQELKKLIR